MTEKARILVVDDTPLNIRVLVENLRDEYSVIAANSGAKALELCAREAKPDLILLDIMMPEMDGYEVSVDSFDSRAFRDRPERRQG